MRTPQVILIQQIQHLLYRYHIPKVQIRSSSIIQGGRGVFTTETVRSGDVSFLFFIKKSVSILYVLFLLLWWHKHCFAFCCFCFHRIFLLEKAYKNERMEHWNVWLFSQGYQFLLTFLLRKWILCNDEKMNVKKWRWPSLSKKIVKSIFQHGPEKTLLDFVFFLCFVFLLLYAVLIEQQFYLTGSL